MDVWQVMKAAIYLKQIALEENEKLRKVARSALETLRSRYRSASSPLRIVRDEEGSLDFVGEKNKKVEVGGIDLNPGLMDLQIKRDRNGMPLPLLQQQLILDMKIDGLVPVIINVTPVLSLPMLLGLAVDTQQNTDEITPVMKAREPEKMSALN